jgi:AP-4 complex subunit mu-1
MQFEIPMYNVSRLAVQYLKIANPTGKKNYNPHRWVRYVTQSSSYVVRT